MFRQRKEMVVALKWHFPLGRFWERSDFDISTTPLPFIYNNRTITEFPRYDDCSDEANELRDDIKVSHVDKKKAEAAGH